MNWKIVVLLASLCLVSHEALSQDAPSAGMVFNRTEDSAITYMCRTLSDDRLTCEFNQTAVRKKAKPTDLAAKLEAAIKRFPEALKEMTKEPATCGSIRGMVAVFKNEMTPNQLLAEYPKLASNREQFIAGLKELRARYVAHADEIASMEAVSQFCDDGLQESFLKMTRLEHQKRFEDLQG